MDSPFKKKEKKNKDEKEKITNKVWGPGVKSSREVKRIQTFESIKKT